MHTRGGLPVVYADRYYKHGGKDGEPRLLMAQACFLQNGVANAAKISRAVLAEFAGQAPPCTIEPPLFELGFAWACATVGETAPGAKAHTRRTHTRRSLSRLATDTPLVALLVQHPRRATE